MVEDIKLVFVPCNGLKKEASVECAYWFPRTSERHSSSETSSLQSGLKDPDVLYARDTRRDCRTTCNRVNKCAVALMIWSGLLNRVCIQERSRAACHCSGIG